MLGCYRRDNTTAGQPVGKVRGQQFSLAVENGQRFDNSLRLPRRT